MFAQSSITRLILMLVLTSAGFGSIRSGFAQTPRVYRDRVEPHWFADDTKFWYRVALPGGRAEFVVVDAAAGTRAPAFDHTQVAKGLSEITGTTVDPGKLPINALKFTEDATKIELKGRGGPWHLDPETGQVTAVGTNRTAQSPDRFFMPPRKSVDRGGDVHLNIQNTLNDAIDLVWMNREGKPQSYGRIAAGEKKMQHTFAGHVWLLKSEDGKPLAAFEAFAGRNEITVTAKALAEAKRSPGQPPRQNKRPSERDRHASTSPDGKLAAFVQDHNLWLKTTGENSGAAPRPLSTDATDGNSFQKDHSRARLVEMQYRLQDPAAETADVRWSPNGKFLLAFQTRKAMERRVYYVESSPAKQLQPRLESYPYAKPGDALPTPTPRLFVMPDGAETEVSAELFPSPFQLKFLRWSEDGNRCWLLYNERGHQTLRLLEINADDGHVRAVVEEHSETFIHYSTSGKLEIKWLPDNQLLWASERSGWNHLYRYRLEDGELLNPVTSGDWNVRRIERVDAEAGVVWFYAVGIRQDQDPYHEHFCRVNLDGTNLKVLTEGDGTHEVRFSPDRAFFLDRYSRVDLPPVTDLRRSDDGKLVTTLETADASEVLAARHSLPRRFVAKGRDGKTDIWGIIHVPLNFDATKHYPVVENIYAGPHDHHVPKRFRSTWRHQHQIADRGMVVVQIDGMGTAWRSKKFHDVCFRNLRDAGFPDRITWMKAASEKYPWMDISRVGIYGGSAGGQNAMAALLWHGTFYKAAVADCGCHDNRMDKLWWNEQWMGWPVGDHYAASSNAANAYRLQGNLLLVVGELDRNVDPASTTQVLHQLVKAHKDFEFLLVPGVGHGACERPYGSRRRADFLARHLAAD